MKKKRSKCELFCRNVVHGSDSPENGKREVGKAFDALLSLTESKRYDYESRLFSVRAGFLVLALRQEYSVVPLLLLHLQQHLKWTQIVPEYAFLTRISFGSLFLLQVCRLIHCLHSAALWFNEGEICEWTPAVAQWLRE